MAAEEYITKVWIEPGCIVCDACETTAPDVFDVQEENCVVRPEALSPDFTKPRTREIIDAAEECPVDVIKFLTVSEEAGARAPIRADQATVGAAASTSARPKAEPEKQSVAGVSEAGAAKRSPTAPGSDVDVPAAAKAAAAKSPKAASDVGDPAIAALLRAATSRGGNAGISRREPPGREVATDPARKDPRNLPPEARQARILEAAKKARQSPDSRRRAFIGNTALAIGWGAFGLGTGVSVGPAFGRFMMPNVLEEPDPRVRVGKLARYREMAPGEVIEDYKPQGIWMIRDGDHIAALSIICTHLGCIPNWLPNDRKFKCPCHGSGYKPNGINFEGPTPRPLERFKVFIEDGIVIVDKSKKYQYELGQWVMPGSYIEV